MKLPLWLKGGVLRAWETPFAVRLLQRSSQERLIILLTHRFTAAGYREDSRSGHDIVKLREMLANLRRNGIALVDVADALHGIDSKQLARTPAKLSVAFTVDDGYSDVVDLASPVFSEFDCPVTSFVVPDVVEQKSWYWWDKLDWILKHSTKRSLQLELQGQPLTLEWSDAPSRQRVKSNLESALKRVTQYELHAFICQLTEVTDTPLPILSPPEYRALSWDEMRSAEQRGMRFGAHSMSHPILSRCDSVQSRYEIARSIERVQAELANPSQVFCYPNGFPDDYGQREYDAVRESGLNYALSTSPGIITRELAESESNWRMEVPRFSYDERFGQLIRYLAT